MGLLGLSPLLFMMGGAGCATRQATATEPALALREGTIRKVGDFAFGIAPASDPGSLYAPEKLAARFRVDGLRVLFAGQELPSPAGVRLWGRPFRITAIRAKDPAP